MERALIIGGLIVIGLLVALVVLSALMYSSMKNLCRTSDELAAALKMSQTKLEAAAHLKMATTVAPSIEEEKDVD